MRKEICCDPRGSQGPAIPISTLNLLDGTLRSCRIAADLFPQNDGIDRMSSLPDDVRKNILSFLSTREAVQTCILSKRWINTWASVLDLKFDIVKEFGFPKNRDEDMAVASATKFELLVKSVLKKREISCVNKFQLSMDFRVYWPRTQAMADCIADVMKWGPRECLVQMGSSEILNLNTDLIFTCESLLYLQLWFNIKTLQAIEPNSVNLPCLKTLYLDGVKMSNDSFKKLLLGCPVLEELMLARFKIEILEICSNSLKKLEVYNICVGVKLQISTPNLLYLVTQVIALEEMVLLNMPLLVDATIYIPGWYDQDIYVTRGSKLVHSLSNVESLHLSFDIPERKVQKKDFSKGPVFNNLKRLELVNPSFLVSDVAPYFLHHSPKLQELTLEYDHYIHARFTEFIDEETTQEENLTYALVQREFLKTVRILGCKNDNEFVDRLINKLLVHVKIIGDIIIHPNGTCQS